MIDMSGMADKITSLHHWKEKLHYLRPPLLPPSVLVYIIYAPPSSPRRVYLKFLRRVTPDQQLSPSSPTDALRNPPQLSRDDEPDRTPPLPRFDTPESPLQALRP